MASRATNLHIYFAIASEAAAESERLADLARTPKPNSEPGVVIRFDPERKSFKNALIAIAFPGIYLEALFYIEGVKRFGAKEYKKHDFKQYPYKLRLFGLSDETTLAEGEHFRTARNSLVHEKAWDLDDPTSQPMFVAQEEAKKAIAFVRSVTERLRKPPADDDHF